MGSAKRKKRRCRRRSACPWLRAASARGRRPRSRRRARGRAAGASAGDPRDGCAQRPRVEGNGSAPHRSKLFAIDVDEFAHDPELEEASIRSPTGTMMAPRPA